ncbi:hypothetical protein KY348_00390 [Candidatus Woesearchaeota archaeon]|nr:hypothetical protein [Candidatus Woesearchaeota archaeon]
MITGCGSKPPEDASNLVGENKEFYDKLESVGIPGDYQFTQFYRCSWSGGTIEKNMSGRFEDGRLVEFHKIDGFYGREGYKDEEKYSCKSHEECEPLYENVNLSDEISLRTTPLSIDRIINILKNKLQPKLDIHFSKVPINGINCFSILELDKPTFMICFNNNDELMYYEDYGGHCGNLVRWKLVGYELDTNQINDIKKTFEQLIFDFKISEQLKGCEGDCKESVYPELISYLGNPSEDCFKVNQTTHNYFPGSEFSIEINKEHAYFCNGEYIQYLLLKTNEETGEKRIIRNSTLFEENPEQMQKLFLFNVLKRIYQYEECPEEEIEKVVLDDGLVCFKIEKTEACNLYWFNKLVVCFTENYLANYYYKSSDGKEIWEKEQYPFPEELL